MKNKTKKIIIVLGVFVTMAILIPLAISYENKEDERRTKLRQDYFEQQEQQQKRLNDLEWRLKQQEKEYRKRRYWTY